MIQFDPLKLHFHFNIPETLLPLRIVNCEAFKMPNIRTTVFIALQVTVYVFLFTSFLVVLSLYIHSTKYSDKSNNDQTELTEEESVQQAKVIAPMNLDADPCENFYEYSCGNFLSHTLIDLEEFQKSLKYESFDATLSILPRLFKTILEQENSCESEIKVAQFFHSCMDEFVEVDKSGDKVSIKVEKMDTKDTDIVKDLMETFKVELNFNLNDSLQNSSKNGNKTLRALNWPIDGVFWNVFFGIYAPGDELIEFNQEIERVVLGIPDEGVVNKLFPVESAAVFEKDVKSFNYLKLVLKESKILQADKLDKLFDTFNNSLEELKTCRDEIDADNYYDSILDDIFKQDYGSLSNFSSGSVDLDKENENFLLSIENLLPEWVQKVLKNDSDSLKITVNASFPKYSKCLRENSSLTNFNNFMQLQFISALHYLLVQSNDTYVDRSVATENQAGNKNPEQKREIECLQSLIPDHLYLALVTSNAYMKYYIGNDSFYQLDKWQNYIKQAASERFDDRIENSTTRKGLKDYFNKIEMRPKPDQISCEFSDALLANLDVKPTQRNSYAKNLLSLQKYYQDIYKSSGSPRMENLVLYVNAKFYHRDQKAQMWTFLIDPLYSYNNPVAVNYGSMVYIMAHEFSHALDERSMQKQYIGNYPWDKITNENYNNFRQCRINLMDEANLNGANLDCESYADISGIQLAYQAMKSNENMAELNRNLKNSPILKDFSAEKLFFVAFAQSHCDASVNEEKNTFNPMKPHPPVWARVNLTLSMLPEFKEVFQCKDDQAMTKGEDCNIWP